MTIQKVGVITTYVNYITVAANSEAACKSQTAVHAKQAMPNMNKYVDPVDGSSLRARLVYMFALVMGVAIAAQWQ